MLATAASLSHYKVMHVLKTCSNPQCVSLFSSTDVNERMCPRCRQAAGAARVAWSDPKMPDPVKKEILEGIPVCPTCNRSLRAMTSTERSRKSRKADKEWRARKHV